ncbi:DUF4942 domain-containing protein [Ruminococcus sp. OM05-10BH]|nr:DUF4942 domain-containing protein [Ruminococcus sp. OM05-10BH]
MSRNLVKGVEDCIIKLFDELFYQHSYDNDLSKNIHYYNGWKTNKSWIINKKVILPWMQAWNSIFGTYRPTTYKVLGKLRDMEKALNYLRSCVEQVECVIGYSRVFRPEADLSGIYEERSALLTAIAALEEVQSNREAGAM